MLLVKNQLSLSSIELFATSPSLSAFFYWLQAVICPMSITGSMSEIELEDTLTLSELPTAWLHRLSTTLTPESAARIRTTCKLLQEVRAWKCCCSTSAVLLFRSLDAAAL
jgi:hypothetical protein